MKKILLTLVCTLFFLASFAQSQFSGIILYVTDSSTYRASSTVTNAHSSGKSDIYWNAEATTPHYDWWNGASYSHGFGSGGGGTWGSITGTLSSQTDLQTALDAKVNDTGNETIAGIKTFSSDPLIPDEVYDATAWNASLEPPTKNAVRDKIETLAALVYDQASASTAGATITLDMNSLQQRSFVGSASFSTDKTIAMSNVTTTSGVPVFFNFFFEVTSITGVEIIVPSDWAMSSSNFDGTDWEPPAIGKYEFGGSYDNTNDLWYIKVSGPFEN